MATLWLSASPDVEKAVRESGAIMGYAMLRRIVTRYLSLSNTPWFSSMVRVAAPSLTPEAWFDQVLLAARDSWDTGACEQLIAATKQAEVAAGVHVSSCTAFACDKMPVAGHAAIRAALARDGDYSAAVRDALRTSVQAISPSEPAAHAHPASAAANLLREPIAAPSSLTAAAPALPPRVQIPAVQVAAAPPLPQPQSLPGTGAAVAPPATQRKVALGSSLAAFTLERAVLRPASRYFYGPTGVYLNVLAAAGVEAAALHPALALAEAGGGAAAAAANLQDVLKELRDMERAGALREATVRGATATDAAVDAAVAAVATEAELQAAVATAAARHRDYTLALGRAGLTEVAGARVRTAATSAITAGAPLAAAAAIAGVSVHVLTELNDLGNQLNTATAAVDRITGRAGALVARARNALDSLSHVGPNSASHPLVGSDWRSVGVCGRSGVGLATVMRTVASSGGVQLFPGDAIAAAGDAAAAATPPTAAWLSTVGVTLVDSRAVLAAAAGAAASPSLCLTYEPPTAAMTSQAPGKSSTVALMRDAVSLQLLALLAGVLASARARQRRTLRALLMLRRAGATAVATALPSPVARENDTMPRPPPEVLESCEPWVAEAWRAATAAWAVFFETTRANLVRAGRHYAVQLAAAQARNGAPPGKFGLSIPWTAAPGEGGAPAVTPADGTPLAERYEALVTAAVHRACREHYGPALTSLERDANAGSMPPHGASAPTDAAVAAKYAATQRPLRAAPGGGGGTIAPVAQAGAAAPQQLRSLGVGAAVAGAPSAAAAAATAAATAATATYVRLPDGLRRALEGVVCLREDGTVRVPPDVEFRSALLNVAAAPLRVTAADVAQFLAEQLAGGGPSGIADDDGEDDAADNDAELRTALEEARAAAATDDAGAAAVVQHLPRGERTHEIDTPPAVRGLRQKRGRGVTTAEGDEDDAVNSANATSVVVGTTTGDDDATCNQNNTAAARTGRNLSKRARVEATGSISGAAVGATAETEATTTAGERTMGRDVRVRRIASAGVDPSARDGPTARGDSAVPVDGQTGVGAIASQVDLVGVPSCPSATGDAHANYVTKSADGTVAASTPEPPQTIMSLAQLGQRIAELRQGTPVMGDHPRTRAWLRWGITRASLRLAVACERDDARA